MDKRNTKKYEDIHRELNERSRRLWEASEAIAIGHVGIRIASRATGISDNTISKGKKTISKGATLQNKRISSDSAMFETSTTQNCWNQMIIQNYPNSNKLLIHAEVCE